MGATAQDVTKAQAEQRATQFVQQHMAQGQGARLAAGAMPELTLAGEPCGLYAFNVEGGGYVIVSPDERAASILGYSDSGNIDPENMPENMRAWLQGYAEEIAFIRGTRYEVRGTEETRGTEEARGARYEVRGASRTNIAPFIMTHWDQFEPYYNECPMDGSDHSVTGCIATAFAQVMYHYQYPNATTKEIPAYTTRTRGFYREAVSAGSSIDYSNMQTAYGWYNHDGSGWVQATYTPAQGAAVAKLMAMIGNGVEMDYTAYSSGGNSELMVPTLTRYFGYDNQTTQRLIRASYSDSQWLDILYHELQNGRPIAYSGVTSGNGGHTFLIDGYQTGDYFHVNWGWSTVSSDGYYLLSAMNPSGTSAYSGNGFNNRQDAVLGIQPLGYGGTLSPEVTNADGVCLHLVDIQWSQNPVLPGSEVEIIAKVANNSANAYTMGIVFIPSDAMSFSTADIIPTDIASGQTVEIRKTITAPSSEGSIKYSAIYDCTGGGSWYKDQGFSTEPLIVSNSATGIEHLSPTLSKGEGAWYSLDGRRVEKPARGLYIHNGKKVIVRD